MAHMACKNAISNIYFELGEFHELNMQLLFRCSPTLNPFERDAQQIWLNLSFFLTYIAPQCLQFIQSQFEIRIGRM